MLSNETDFAPFAAQLRATGRVQIPGFLQREAAVRLQQHLAEEVPWTLAIRDADGPRTLPNAEYSQLSDEARQSLLREVAQSARGGAYRFAYDSYMMVTAYREGRDPGLLLHRVLEFLNTPELIEFARRLTGEPRVRRLSAQATRYTPGQFLRQHDDQDVEEGRLFAYVINLSEGWQADWGGLLQFTDAQGQVIDTFVPRFNSLSLFRVPVRHLVSMVNPWADQPRLAITGWMLS
jgi:SM-20-related protein